MEESKAKYITVINKEVLKDKKEKITTLFHYLKEIKYYNRV